MTIYLDHAASTPLAPCALKTLQESFGHDFANPSAGHRLGKSLMNQVNEIRDEMLKDFGGTELFNLVFTSSATESTNLFIAGVDMLEGGHAFYSSTDHPSLKVPLEARCDAEVRGLREIPLKMSPLGEIDEEKLLELINEQTRMVALSWVNNTSGLVNSVGSLAKKIKQINPHTLVFVDGVQAVGKYSLGHLVNYVDGITLSAHKMGGPKGVAGLIFKKELTLNPLLRGGGHEFGLRSSTLNVPLIKSWMAVYRELKQNRESYKAQAAKIHQQVKTYLQELNQNLEFPFEQVSPYILSFFTLGISSDILMRQLENEKIYISSSSACSSKHKQANPVLAAYGINPDKHSQFLRVSFGTHTTEDEVLVFCQTLQKIYQDLSHLIRK